MYHTAGLTGTHTSYTTSERNGSANFELPTKGKEGVYKVHKQPSLLANLVPFADSSIAPDPYILLLMLLFGKSYHKLTIP